MIIAALAACRDAGDLEFAVEAGDLHDLLAGSPDDQDLTAWAVDRARLFTARLACWLPDPADRSRMSALYDHLTQGSA